MFADFGCWFDHRIIATQFIGAPLYLVNRQLYYAWMARTKMHFGVVATTVTQWWSPTVIRVTGDKSVRHQIKRGADGELQCQFPERLVLIANHQVFPPAIGVAGVGDADVY
jgi:lysocardiolipin and lysophospholipid acyltransferase